MSQTSSHLPYIHKIPSIHNSHDDSKLKSWLGVTRDFICTMDMQLVQLHSQQAFFLTLAHLHFLSHLHFFSRLHTPFLATLQTCISYHACTFGASTTPGSHHGWKCSVRCHQHLQAVSHKPGNMHHPVQRCAGLDARGFGVWPLMCVTCGV